MKAATPPKDQTTAQVSRMWDAYSAATDVRKDQPVIHKAGYSSTITVAMLTEALDDMRDKIMQQVSDELSRIESVIMDALQK